MSKRRKNVRFGWGGGGGGVLYPFSHILIFHFFSINQSICNIISTDDSPYINRDIAE